MRLGVLSDPNNFHTQKWAGALARAGAEVKVFSFNAYLGEEVEAVQVPLGGRLSYRDYLRGGKLLGEALKAHKVEVVNALNLTPFGVWAGRSGHRPLIASAMGADVLEFARGRYRPRGLGERSWDNVEGGAGGWAALKAGLLRPVYRHYVKEALGRADLVTADNQVLVDVLREDFGVEGERLRLLRFGLEPELFVPDGGKMVAIRKKLGIAEGKKVVLSPRGLKAVYQADVILEGFKRLLDEGREDVCFVMLGAGYPVSEGLRMRARGLGGRLILVEEVLDRATLGQLWNMVDVFVSAPVYDGYSAAVAEGRYAGAVPVVNGIPGNLEVIRHGENGWVCDPFDAEGLAGALRAVLDDVEGWKRRVGPVNRAWIEAHSLVGANARFLLQMAKKLLR